MTDEEFGFMLYEAVTLRSVPALTALVAHARECRAALRRVPLDHDPPCDDRRLDAQGDPAHWICTCHVAEVRRLLGETP